VSKCISPRGEYSEHTLDGDFVCTACLGFDEDAVIKELRRLRADTPPCDGGCNENTGPEETCSLHGRTTADVWQIVYRVMAESDHLRSFAQALADSGTGFDLNPTTDGKPASFIRYIERIDASIRARAVDALHVTN